MRKIDNHTILTRFISKEIAEVYKKYSKIGDDEVGLVGAFIDKIEGNGVDFSLYQDYHSTKALAETLKDEDNINLIKLYIFLTTDLKLRESLIANDLATVPGTFAD